MPLFELMAVILGKKSTKERRMASMEMKSEWVCISAALDQAELKKSAIG